eukprot:7724179-Pyramimonas_sp.AAC.1
MGEEKDSESEQLRACNQCKQKKPLSDLHKKEYRCKGCRSSRTAFDRRYEKKHGEKALEKLKEDKKEYNQRINAFNALAPTDSTNCNRRNTENLGTMQLTNVANASSGVMNYTECKMMWEREWYEEAQETKFGNLTLEEAKRQWALW